MSQYGSHMFPNVGGSFYYQQDTTANDRAEITMHDVAAARDNYYFSASAANSAYSGSSVQPKAIQILMIIKVWIAEGCKILDEYKELESEAQNLRFDNAQVLL